MNGIAETAPTQVDGLKALSPKNQELLNFIMQLDLSEVAKKFFDQHPEMDLDATIAEYRYYLFLCKAEYAEGRTRLPIPNERTDEFWHAHLLFTEDYLAFCSATMLSHRFYLMVRRFICINY